jgi:hypothetical protein
MADKKNGVNQLAAPLEELRMQVVELELKARFWKANFEIRQYSLGFDSLTEKYSEFVTKQQQIDEATRAAFKEQVDKLQSLGATVDQPTGNSTDAGPVDNQAEVYPSPALDEKQAEPADIPTVETVTAD